MSTEFAKDPGRVGVTTEARRLIEQLQDTFGPIMFHLSGGCCDGSAPMCFPVGEFKLGGVDEKVGEIAGCEFWMDRAQFRLLGPYPVDGRRRPGKGRQFLARSPAQHAFFDSIGDVRRAERPRGPIISRGTGSGQCFVDPIIVRANPS